MMFKDEDEDYPAGVEQQFFLLLLLISIFVLFSFLLMGVSEGRPAALEKLIYKSYGSRVRKPATLPYGRKK